MEDNKKESLRDAFFDNKREYKALCAQRRILQDRVKNLPIDSTEQDCNRIELDQVRRKIHENRNTAIELVTEISGLHKR